MQGGINAGAMLREPRKYKRVRVLLSVSFPDKLLNSSGRTY